MKALETIKDPGAILESAGVGIDRVFKATCFLSSFDIQKKLIYNIQYPREALMKSARAKAPAAAVDDFIRASPAERKKRVAIYA